MNGKLLVKSGHITVLDYYFLVITDSGQLLSVV